MSEYVAISPAESWKYTPSHLFDDAGLPNDAVSELCISPHPLPDGVRGDLPTGLVVGADHDGDRPLIVEHRSTREVAATTRLRIRCEPGARLHLVELFEGSKGFVRSHTHLVVDEGAEVEHLRIVRSDADLRHLGQLQADVGARAKYGCVSFVRDAAACRVELSASLLGEGADVELAGLALVAQAQHVDHHVSVDHAVAGTRSRQLFRSVLNDQGRSVFTGRIGIRRDAQQTDSAQEHRALLLSGDARVNARPQLEIYADDVKAAHGAAVGALDSDALFYLQQRGLTSEAARALLVSGFASEIVERVPDLLRADVSSEVASWLLR